MSARRKAEDVLGEGHRYSDRRSSIAVATAIAGKRIGYAILDLADAVREHTASERELATRIETVERCPAHIEPIAEDVPDLQCGLPRGHTGAHRDAESGAEWSPR